LPNTDPDLNAADLCTAIVEVVRVFGSKSAACLSELGSCIDDCTPDREDHSDSRSVDHTSEGICLANGLNGTCPGYARELVACGGRLRPDSHEACMSRCSSTTGAWIDDLDTLCVEECD
jgi:hypothetical protein